MSNIERGFSPEISSRKLELEKYDQRAALLSEGPDQEATTLMDSESVYEFEKNCTCQAMGLTLQPNGRIIASPTGLYLPEDNRLAYEDIRALSQNNPNQLEINLKIRQAVESLMRTGESGLTEDLNTPLSRVAIGVCYRYFDPVEQTEKLVFRINNDKHNRYKDWATSLSSLVKILRPTAHPGRYVQQSFEEVIPGSFDDRERFTPFWPSGYSTGGGRHGYKDRLEAVRGISLEDLSNPATDAYASYHSSERPAGRGMDTITSDVNFATARITTPISLQFAQAEGKKPQTLNNLIANYNPLGSLELLKIIDLETSNSQRPSFLDPACGSMIVEIPISELVAHTEKILGNNQFYETQEYALPTNDFPEIEVQLYNGRNGSLMNKENIPNIMRMAPNVWGAAKHFAFENRRNKAA